MSIPVRCLACLLCLFSGFANAAAPSSGGNRFAYLDGTDPFYVHLDSPRLTTPQWVGETNVQAVVVLAIDDMREPQKYEAFLRPILTRLKEIDGRAPVSIMCNALAPDDAQLQAWLKEGLSLEVHTLSHPCPLLQKGDFQQASDTFHGCVELLNTIPGNRPTAYRMPCCDSMNSPSPRFYFEIFNTTNAAGQFLTIDSSVMTLLTPNDPALPRALVLDAEGRERFRKYLPTETNATTRVSMESFVTTIEDYPYPYVIGNVCWEFPCMVPSDWEAHNLQGSNHPETVEDWKAALDAVVIKQGVFNLVFHPHGWIRSDQVIDLINHAAEKYGPSVKFLSFREAQARLDKHLLQGNPLRNRHGRDNGVRLIDLNQDGFQDVVIGNPEMRRTRLWLPTAAAWAEGEFPTDLVRESSGGSLIDTGVRFGVLESNTVMLVRRPDLAGAWRFDGQRWAADGALLAGLELEGEPVFTAREGRDRGARLRDLDGDGRCEFIVANESQNAVFAWSPVERSWRKAKYALPEGGRIVGAEGHDAGLRWVDLNEDGHDDILFSNPERCGVYLFVPKPVPHLGWERGWTREIRSGKAGEDRAIPQIVREGPHRNNGVWFHSRRLWMQNEDTAHLPDKVDRRSFAELLTFEAPPARTPEESLKALQVRPGFKVELAASEPLVMDPVAFDWGADGRLWIVEMRDYPSGLDGRGKPGGRVRFLEDRDGDGRYEESTIFLDDINFPTGLMPWREGILVSAAPDIFYAEDTNGDGKADKRVVLFSGFNEGNQQHRVNGFELGLDGWVYGANGDSGGNIHSVGAVKARDPERTNAPPIDLRGHDFRFRPDEGVFETVEGQTQFGRHRDDWGNWFGNNNPAWLWHYWIPEQYLRRNPHLALRSTKESLANYPGNTRVFAVSQPLARFNWPGLLNILTSANSPTPYRDELFGPDFASTIFISEPANNLVHREVLDPSGVTFTSRRALDEQDREFLASADNWFRPTMLKTGPDGALYIADMYRLAIEHLEYALPGMEKQIDVRAGDDKGRLYRVYPEAASPREIRRLDQLGPVELVAALDSPNGWQRDTAQRLLLHARDRRAIDPLANLFRTTRNAKARVQALWTLADLGGLDAGLLDEALKDAHPIVREHAVRLSEPFAQPPPPLAGTLSRLVNDPEIRVRYQLAFSLGERGDEGAGHALAALALRDAALPQMRTAIMTSAPKHCATMLDALVRQHAARPEAVDLLDQVLALAVATKQDESVLRALHQIGRPRNRTFAAWQFESLAGFLEALDRRGDSFSKFKLRMQPQWQTTVEQIDRAFAAAGRVAGNSRAPEQERIAAIGLMGHQEESPEQSWRMLGDLLTAKEPLAIQQAALRALSRAKDEGAAEMVLAHWRQVGPGLRNQVLGALLSRPAWATRLLRALEAGEILRPELGPAQQQRLLQHSLETIRKQAARILGGVAADRQQILKDYRHVPQLKGDAENGAAIFRQQCASCHRFRNEGTTLGPDLGSLSDKSVEALLVGILDPNRSVEETFVSYSATTRDGRDLSGIITAETANSITLRTAGGMEEIILRSEVKEVKSGGLSLMPEGLEKAIPPQGMADLIRYLQN